MRKILFFSIMIIAVILIISGLLTTDGHISQDKAQEIAKELTGQSVTYVTTHEYPDDKMKVFVFADPQGREFAIVSKMLPSQARKSTHFLHFPMIQTTKEKHVKPTFL